MKEFFTKNYIETFELGKKFGLLLNVGDVVVLSGELGAGKTDFAGGIASALEVEGYITSPTFTIVNVYNGKLPFYHFDVYRLLDSDELLEIGFEDYIYGNGVVVIEWGDKVSDMLPNNYIKVVIEKSECTIDERKITFYFIGESSKYREDQL
jgi:tRNA threonylcarbamoyladenosine biosynthesis protein TsaE